MKTFILILALLLVSTRSVTTGSCQRYSLDGEKCEQCVSHYHLFEGSCYVDILGCASYSFGNICESCDNNYILVNNLCCDHNCMLKFMKRQQSSNVKKAIGDNFEILSKIIPFMNDKYAQEGAHTLLEIEVRQYLDVTRYVLLYEFFRGKSTMKRAVVDYTVKDNKMIVVDWSTVADRSQFLEFHKEEIPLQNQSELKPLLNAIFKQSPSIALANKVIFTELTQYEIVVNDQEKETILYKTVYLWSNTPLYLISESKPMPTFVPSQLTLEGSGQIAEYSSANPSFIKVVSFLQADPRYKPEITRVLINHKTRYLNQYGFSIVSENGKMEYFLIEDLKNNDIKIVMFNQKEKQELNEVVEEAVKIITEEETEQEPSEEAEVIVDIVDEAVKVIIKEHKEDESLDTCEGVDCEKRQQLEKTQQQVEEQKIIQFFRSFNPEITDFEVLKIWNNDNFNTFSEWTLKVRYGDNVMFFFALQNKKTEEFTYWGHSTDIDSESRALPNPQQEVPENVLDQARKTITSEFPETQTMLFRRGIERNFPEGRKREIIILRAETSRLKYVVLKNEEGVRYVQEWETVATGLPELNEKVKEKEKLAQKVEVIVEEIITGKPIDSEVDLSDEKPIEITVEEEVEPEEAEEENTSPEQQVVEQVEETADEKLEHQMVKLMRQNTKELTNFENLHEWKVVVDDETEQRIILVRDFTTQKYYYFTFIYKPLSSTVTFISSTPSETVVENESGNFVLPVALQNAQPQTFPEQETTIVGEILEEVFETIETEVEVSESEADPMLNFVRQNNEDLIDAKLVRKWDFPLRTYSENTLLLEKGGKYWYVFVFHWFEDNAYTVEGIEETLSPVENENGKKVIPIELRNVVDNEKGEQILSEVMPEIEGWRRVRKTMEAVYPSVHRYIVKVRFDTQKIRYVFHEKDGEIKYVEETILRENLPSRNTKEEIIETIVEEAFEEVVEEHKQDVEVTDCKNRNCDQTTNPETQQNSEEKEQLAIVQLFREKNPQVEGLEVVKIWKNEKFLTFVEWTVNIKFSDQSIFFYALEEKETKQLTFWGQENIVSETLPNPQSMVPEEDVSDARQQIVQEFPETENLPTRRTVLRVFPDNRERVIYVLRHQTSKVRYVTLKDSEGKIIVKEWETLEENLPALNKQQKQKVELENKVEIIVEETLNGKPIEESVDLSEQDPIEIAVETPEETHQVVVEESQIIKVKESDEEGIKVEHIRTVTHDDEETLNKITSFVETTEKYKIEEREKRIITQEIPISVVSQTFCDTQDYFLFYDLGESAVAFAFRTSLTNSGQFQYLGKRQITKSSSWPDTKVIKELTEFSQQFDAAAIESTISASYPEFEGKTSYKIITNQLGQHLRFLVLYNQNGEDFIERFVVSSPITSSDPAFEVIEECRLQKTKTKETTTKVTVTGESEISTTEVQTLIKEDEIAEQVDEFIRKDKNLEDFNATHIKTTEYETAVEYEIELEKVVEDHEGEADDVVEVVQEVVIHDKVTHENKVIEETRENKTVQEIVEEKRQQVKEKDEKEDVFVVVDPSEKEKLPEKVAEALDNITEEVKNQKHLTDEEYEVKTVLVEDEGEIDKVKEIIQKKDGSEKIIVTGVIDEKTGEHYVEEVKVVDETVIEHLVPVEDKKPEQAVTVDPSEIQEIIIEVEQKIIEKLDEKEGECCNQLRKEEPASEPEEKQKTKEKPTEEEREEEPVSKQHTVEIVPGDIQTVIEEVFGQKQERTEEKDDERREEIVAPTITLTSDEAVNFLHSIKPQTEKYRVIESFVKQFPQSAAATIEMNSGDTDVSAVVMKDVDGIKLTYFQEFISSSEETVEQIVETIEEEDIAEYKPIDPENVYYLKALQILNSQSKGEFEKEVDLNEANDVVTQAVLTVRTNYPIVKDSNVIRVLEIFNTANIKQYVFYFYVPAKGQSYSVYAITVEYNSQAAEPVYKVLTVQEIIKDSKLINKMLEDSGQNAEPHINIAYGYENVNLADASHDSAILDIQSEIQTKYASLIAGQTIIEIQKLQLKNGKINYVVKYDNVYFTIYYDKVLMRIVLLNAVTSLNNQQYSPVTTPETNQLYKMALQHLIGQHTADLKDFKVVSSGQISNSTHQVFQIQIFSQGHKYRGIVAVHLESTEVSEISWNEVVEVDLKHINYMQLFVEEYQRVSGSQLEENNYFNMIDTYARNRNPTLVEAEVLGVAYKPQNLGFNYKIFYKLRNSELISVEVYIESFTEKINQISLVYEDFSSNFIQVKPQGEEVRQILQVLANKAGISLNEKEYLIQSVEAKDFLFGNLYKMTLEIDGVVFQGLLYHDHTTQEANLLSWLPVRNTQSCEVWEVQDVKCEKCSQGYYLSISEKLCYRETVGCNRYSGDFQTCTECESDLSLTNHICVKDCGALCLAIALP